MAGSGDSGADGYYDESGRWRFYPPEDEAINSTYIPAPGALSSASHLPNQISPAQGARQHPESFDIGPRHSQILEVPPYRPSASLFSSFPRLPPLNSTGFGTATQSDPQLSHRRSSSHPSLLPTASSAPPLPAPLGHPLDVYHHGPATSHRTSASSIPATNNSYRSPPFSPMSPLSPLPSLPPPVPAGYLDEIQEPPAVPDGARGVLAQANSPNSERGHHRHPNATLVPQEQNPTGPVEQRSDDPSLIAQSSGDNDSESDPGEVVESSKYPGLMGRKKETFGGRRARKYQCSRCTKCFARPSSLFQHERTHTGERPFSCPICLDSFSTSSNCNRHIRSHARNGVYPPSSADTAAGPTPGPSRLPPGGPNAGGSGSHWPAQGPSS